MARPADETLATTPLDALHRALGARMVPFAGYAMPVQYDSRRAGRTLQGGVMAEHLHCRSQAALFDVSHMGQATLHGRRSRRRAGALVPGDIAGLKPGRQRYTLFTNEAGGIIDDLMVANLGDEGLFLVVNASRKEVDFAHLREPAARHCAWRCCRTARCWRCRGPQAAAVHGAASRPMPPTCRSWACAAVDRRRRALPGVPLAATPARTGSRFRVPAEQAE